MYIYNYLHNYVQVSSKPWPTDGSAEQPLQVPCDRALNQSKPHPSGRIVRMADRICSNETPDWKALEAANALTSWALTLQ